MGAARNKLYEGPWCKPQLPLQQSTTGIPARVSAQNTARNVCATLAFSLVGRTPGSAADAPVGLLAFCQGLRDEGVPRGRGRPPHNCGSVRLISSAPRSSDTHGHAACKRARPIPRAVWAAVPRSLLPKPSFRRASPNIHPPKQTQALARRLRLRIRKPAEAADRELCNRRNRRRRRKEPLALVQQM